MWFCDSSCVILQLLKKSQQIYIHDGRYLLGTHVNKLQH